MAREARCALFAAVASCQVFHGAHAYPSYVSTCRGWQAGENGYMLINPITDGSNGDCVINAGSIVTEGIIGGNTYQIEVTANRQSGFKLYSSDGQCLGDVGPGGPWTTTETFNWVAPGETTVDLYALCSTGFADTMSVATPVTVSAPPAPTTATQTTTTATTMTDPPPPSPAPPTPPPPPGQCNARDGRGQELFPLSGGVSNGIRVTVKAASLSTAAGATQLEFFTPDGAVGFRWNMNTAAQSINRSSDFGETAETWGQSTVDANGALSFEFYKTSESWQVSIATGGAAAVRFPWFDFTLQSTDVMTHLSVYDGFVDVEVIQDRPLCDTACHASECASTCGTDEAPETCYSTTPSMECSSEQLTGHLTDADRVCCDGLGRRIAIDPVPVSDWVAVADAALLTRACAAFPSSASCTDHPGSKAQVRSCDDVSKTCEVWVPAAQTAESTGPAAPPSDAILTLPAYGLVSKSDLQTRSIVVPDPEYRLLWDVAWQAGTFQVDYHTGLVFSATAQAAIDYTIDRGWFITMIRYDPGYWYGTRWFQYSAAIVDELARSGKGDVSIFVTDEPVLLKPVCGQSYYPDPFPEIPQMAGQVWHDYKGNNCSVYEERDYCTRHGEPTQAWCDDIFFPNFDDSLTCVPGVTDMNSYGCELSADTSFKCRDPNGVVVKSFPVYECCECGGGDSAAPVGWVEPAKKMVFQ